MLGRRRVDRRREPGSRRLDAGDGAPCRASWRGGSRSATRRPTRAYELARRAGDGTDVIVGILLATARIMTGRDDGDGERELLDRWPEALDERILLPGAPHLIGLLQGFGWVERYDDADVFAARLEEMIEATGAVGALTLFRAGQSEIDMRRGDWALAQARARRGAPARRRDRPGRAALAADDGARAAGGGAGPRGPVPGGGARGAPVRRERPRADAVRPRPGGARACSNSGSAAPLAPSSTSTKRPGSARSTASSIRASSRYGPDRVEALLRAGGPEPAEAALVEFEAMAARVRRSWPTAAAARCRGLLAGEDEFDSWFERAYEAHGPAASPFELGRTELCHGERLRRARRVREGRERLRAALERFEALGAAPWAARARSELRASGAAVGAPRSPATRDLTPQELEVALAVARGGYEPRGGCRAVREPEDDRGPPLADLPQAGSALSHRAGDAHRGEIGKSPMAFQRAGGDDRSMTHGTWVGFALCAARSRPLEQTRGRYLEPTEHRRVRETASR